MQLTTPGGRSLSLKYPRIILGGYLFSRERTPHPHSKKEYVRGIQHLRLDISSVKWKLCQSHLQPGSSLSRAEHSATLLGREAAPRLPSDCKLSLKIEESWQAGQPFVVVCFFGFVFWFLDVFVVVVVFACLFCWGVFFGFGLFFFLEGGQYK